MCASISLSLSLSLSLSSLVLLYSKWSKKFCTRPLRHGNYSSGLLYWCSSAYSLHTLRSPPSLPLPVWRTTNHSPMAQQEQDQEQEQEQEQAMHKAPATSQLNESAVSRSILGARLCPTGQAFTTNAACFLSVIVLQGTCERRTNERTSFSVAAAVYAAAAWCLRTTLYTTDASGVRVESMSVVITAVSLPMDRRSVSFLLTTPATRRASWHIHLKVHTHTSCGSARPSSSVLILALGMRAQMHGDGW